MANSIVSITSVQDLLNFIRQDADINGNLSIRGVARLAGVADKSIVNGGSVNSQRLLEKLTAQGFEVGSLIADGFPPQSVILVLEYFAYESKAKAEQAKQIMRTFGALGLMTALETLRNIPTKPEKQLPQRNIIDYVDAAEKIPNLKVNEQLKRLLEDALTDELELFRNQKILGEKQEYTIVKVRAKELGYSEKQIGSGSGLGRFVAQHFQCAFVKRIGDFSVKHYLISPELDEVIHAYFR